jgi:hypothetical protein
MHGNINSIISLKLNLHLSNKCFDLSNRCWYGLYPNANIENDQQKIDFQP